MWYDLMLYSAKAGVCLAVFYLFFKLLLSRETFHRFNRIVVLAAVALSFVLPLCVITVVRELPALPELPTETAAVLPAEPQPEPFPWERLATAVFLIGAAVTLGRMLRSIGGVVRLIRRGRRERLDDGAVLVRLDEAVMPFSWGRYIVLSERDYAESGPEILIHERAHLRLRHSWDLLLTDLAGCLQWFNPAMWLLRRELRAIHEYEADEVVLDSGVDARHYQLMLIKKAAGGRWYSIANSFNHSKLKNRITMMLQKKSSRWAAAKALFLLPLTGLALGAFARTAYVAPQDKVTKESVTVQITDGKTAVAGIDGKPLVLVDGKQAASTDGLPSDRIAQVKVYKGAAATDRYGEKGKDGVIEVTLRKEGDAAEAGADLPEEKVVVIGAGLPEEEVVVLGSGEKPGPELTGEVVRVKSVGDNKTYVIRGRGEDAVQDDPSVFIIDGKMVNDRSKVDLKPEDILHMRVDKSGSESLIFITTKKGTAQRAQEGVKAAREGVVAAREGIKAGQEGIEAARAALESNRKQMNKKEWKAALRQLDDAKKQIEQAREQIRAAEQEIADAKQPYIGKTSGQADVTVHTSITTNADGEKENSVTLSADKLSYNTISNGIKGNPLIIIDGKKADKAALEKIGSGRIHRMNIYKGDVAVKKYGEEARDGAIEISTQK
ncbi:M56 family metallopeptidase [Alistipes sp.]|uniref:M56 family metallopeptidase n=1 Tax=Alistipes sp. TaxID=1872444 RepID=UPI003AF13DFA